MRAKTIQVVWHGKEPIFSVDFHPNGLLATAGADKDIKLWQVKVDSSGDPEVHPTGSISGHTKTVNCVRFSPTGELLASGGDGGEMILWKDTGTARRAFGSEEDTTWKVASVLRGHLDDVQDVAWSPDASALVSGSIENLCIVWDVEAGKGRVRLENHKHYVQGVSWDPASRYLATLSSDRSCRVYGPKPPAAGKKPRAAAGASAQGGGVSCAAAARDLVCQHVLAKRPVGGAAGAGQQRQQDASVAAAAAGAEAAAAPVAAAAPSAAKERHFLFHDETLPTFFRRLAWAPDGSFLVVPTGSFKASASGPPSNATYVYSRSNWAAPSALLPGLSKASVAVRFAPVVFRRRQPVPKEGKGSGDGGEGSGCGSSAFLQPYRMVFAVATLDSVVVYDTESVAPLALLGALHFAAITDLAWSSDARMLAVSSRDGYCSIALFEDGELGEPVPPEELQPHIAQRLTAAQKMGKPLDRKPKPSEAAAAAVMATKPAAAAVAQGSATPGAQPPAAAATAAAATTAAQGSAAATPAAAAAPAVTVGATQPTGIATGGAAATADTPGSGGGGNGPPSSKKRRIMPQQLMAPGSGGQLPAAQQRQQQPQQQQQQAASGEAPLPPAAKKRITPQPVQPPQPLPGSLAAGAAAAPAAGARAAPPAPVQATPPGAPAAAAAPAPSGQEGHQLKRLKKRVIPEPIND